MKRNLASIFLLLFCAIAAAAQDPSPPAVKTPTPAEARFLATADDVMAEISKLLDLPVKSPLKKSIRSREEIRQYLLQQLRESKEKDKRYADQLALERFGLLPKGFDLEGHLVDLLTEQVAGLYDPKSEEFFIADWMDALTQRVVMAHELVHALHDQNFKIEVWSDAAKPNDDAELARHAVLEGSATAAMIDYLLRGRPDLKIRDNPAFESLVRNMMGIPVDASSPELAKSPPFVRDILLFPYLNGALFTQKVLQQGAGWKEFWGVFQKPPVSSQQILHPELYIRGVVPEAVSLPNLTKVLGKNWDLLDENVMGEFGLRGLLKQNLDEARAEALSPQWRGDRYAIYQSRATMKTALAFRVRLADEVSTTRFFGQYAEALEKKYNQREKLFRRPNFFSFESEDGPVFLHCNLVECITLEGAPRETLDALVKVLQWPIPPRPSSNSSLPTKRAHLHEKHLPGILASSGWQSLPHPGAFD